MAMEIDSLTHPNPTPDPYHRKIELQSPQDLTYLQTNLSNSARQKLDLHFPLQKSTSVAPPATVILLDGGISSTFTTNQSQNGAISNDQVPNNTTSTEEEEEDPLRKRVRELVDTFMSRTWKYASESISVNGLDATSLPQFTLASSTSTNPKPSSDEPEREGVHFTYAAYDSNLQSKVASLYGELETLTAQVSKLRRTAPGKGAELSRQLLQKEIRDDEIMHETYRNRIAEEIDEEDLNIMGDNVGTNWSQDVREMYDRGTNELRSLGGLNSSRHAEGNGNRDSGGVGEGSEEVTGPSLTETVGKLQRARTVAMEFE